MGDWLAIADFLISRSDDIATACVIVTLIIAAWIAVAEHKAEVAEHKAELWRYITHRRNKWFIGLLVVYAAMIVWLAQNGQMSVGGVWDMILPWVVYCTVCLLSLKPKTEYTNLILKH